MPGQPHGIPKGGTLVKKIRNGFEVVGIPPAIQRSCVDDDVSTTGLDDRLMIRKTGLLACIHCIFE
jgi:hypothetical protein